MFKMKKKILFVLFIFIVMTIMGCSSREQDRVPQFLDVQLTVNPEKGNTNEPIIFTAKVTYGDKAVTDPNDIKFEIWRANDENHEKFPVEHKGEGVYELERSFSQEGTYYIYAHVTAEGMHNMPKKEFIIGQPSETEENGGSSLMDEKDSNIKN